MPSLALALSLYGRSATLAAPSVTSNNFDFIIVGGTCPAPAFCGGSLTMTPGGTAGAVVANRLTENPNFKVLLIEAGQSATPNTPYDWNYTTVAQPGLGGRSIPYPRGHILGGSSSVNYMIYTRGSQDDFDRYASVTRDQGWSWKSMQQYFRKNERFTPPVDNHDVTNQVDLSIHSKTGINSVSVSGFPTPIDGRVINATSQLGGDFKFNLDINSGNELGFGWLQVTTDGPRRSSSATSYLAPNFRQRPNLHIVLGAQVSRLLQTGTEHGLPAFRGVEYRLKSDGSIRKATATREVILSAGSIGSPQILLNSGIGASTDLTAVGIKPIVNLPDVGENLSDHSLLGNGFLVNSTETFDDFTRDPSIAAKDIEVWKTTGKGFLVDTIANHFGFIRLPKTDPIFKTNADPSAGLRSAHYELLIANSLALIDSPPTGNFLGIATVVLTPSSRGSVKLRSNNLFDTPLIDPGLLKTDFDKATMRAAVKSALKFLTAPSWAGYVISPVGGLESAQTDAQLDAYIQNNGATIFHPVGTASMSPKGAKTGVVDPDLKVKKVVGLRVVDASVLPFVPSAHTQAPVYAVAERASDLIKAAYA
ncbi:hypothetical protein DXG01_008296 [Tephrocybe rancida]|nr:hypothetical protein DXG01_008296 [Tephrocybe rancida]